MVYFFGSCVEKPTGRISTLVGIVEMTRQNEQEILSQKRCKGNVCIFLFQSSCPESQNLVILSLPFWMSCEWYLYFSSYLKTLLFPSLLKEVSILPSPTALYSQVNTQAYTIINCLADGSGFLLASFLFIINPFLLICISPHSLGLPVMPRCLAPLAGTWHLPESAFYLSLSLFGFSAWITYLSIGLNSSTNKINIFSQHKGHPPSLLSVFLVFLSILPKVSRFLCIFSHYQLKFRCLC